MVKQVSIAYSDYKNQDHTATFWREKGALGGLKHLGFLPCQTNSSKENQSE